MLSFHWTGLKQDTSDMRGARYEYDFTWLYILKSGFSILEVRGYNTLYNGGATTGGSSVRTSTLANII